MIVVGCSSTDSEKSQNENKAKSNNKKEEKQEEKDEIVNEETLVDRLIEAINENKDTLLKNADYFFTIQDKKVRYYNQESSIGEDDDEIVVRTSLASSNPEFYGEEEPYELKNGLSGMIGEIDDGYVSFISSTDDKEVEIFLGELSIEEGKEKLAKLEFIDEEITKEDLKEMVGFDFETVHYFDNKDTKYDNVSEVFIRTNIKKSFGVRYRNHDAGEYDAVDVYVSKEAFPRDKNIEPERLKTKKGKTVEVIDDGLYVDWYWEEDGYYYNIAGNYNADDKKDDAKKEYNLEVIDNITKQFGE